MKKRHQFNLFQTPLDLAHDYWLRLLNPGDWVVDATCGNGYDTLFLAKIVLNNEKRGRVVAIDKQEQAVQNTKNLLNVHLSEDFRERVIFYTQCHSSFPSILQTESINLLVYNLGYLPGANKNLTTDLSTTLQSLKAALPLITKGGAISITCYTGHEAGKPEEEAVLNFAASLDPREWSSCHHRWLNRNNSPSLILLQHRMPIPVC